VVEEAFNRMVDRDDIGIVLINQHVRPSGEEGEGVREWSEEGACSNQFSQAAYLGRESKEVSRSHLCVAFTVA